LHFELTQDQQLLQETVREFARGELAPSAAKMDWEAKVPNEIFGKLPSLGLFGISLPAEYGGAGADFLSLLLVTEELSKISGSLGARVSFHNAVVCDTIASSKNQELKSALLPKLVSGSLGAFVIDPKSTIKSSFEGSQIVLNGSAQYAANADAAGVFLILAKMKDGSKSFVSFAKDQDEEIPGFAVSAPEKLLGMRAAGTAKVEFLNFPLPKNAILFDDNEVSAAMRRILTRSRLAVAGQALGIGQAALDAEISYANERSQFNTKIGKFYAVQDFIAADHIAIETARMIAYKTSREIEDSHTLERDSAVAKVSSSNAAVQTARHSIRIHGGYGFIRDYPVERYLRDARVTQSYIESNEALKAKIAESLLGTPNW